MAYEDKFRLSSHAVITDADDKILQIKATYGDYIWGLPGGALDPGETVHDALLRECQEELGVAVEILYMSGIYFHQSHNSHAVIFRCKFLSETSNIIKLSDEHSAYRYFGLAELSVLQQQRVLDCMQFDGQVKSAKF